MGDERQQFMATIIYRYIRIHQMAPWVTYTEHYTEGY